jgi:hypothetical protein
MHANRHEKNPREGSGVCEVTGKRYHVWLKFTPDDKPKGWWKCYDCGHRRRARKKATVGG